MLQRQSLKFPPRPPSFPSEEERLAQTIAIVKYFISEDRCLTPTLFFNVEEFGNVVLNGKFTNDAIVPRTDIDGGSDDAVLAVTTLTLIADEAVGLVLNFDLGNTIGIVGSKEQYYFIDLFHDICYVTKSPEYDIMAYESEYGESEFKAYYFSSAPSIEPIVGEKRAEPVASVTLPPPQKKKKTPVPKKVTPPPPPPTTTTEACEAK